jgi:tight adherence protein B
MSGAWRAVACAGVLALITVLGPGGEAGADPSTGLTISGVQTQPGQLAFVLSGAGLPADGKGLSVRVDGVPVATTVRPGAPGSPTGRAVAIVLDARWPAAGEPLAAARAAIAAYVGALPADVGAGLVAVTEQVRVLATPDEDRGAVTAGLGQVTAQGDIPLEEGVRRALELLPAAGVPRRVLVVSDGGTTGSPDEAVAPAALNVGTGAPIDVVYTGAGAAPPALRQLAARSAGRLRAGLAPAGLAAATAFPASLALSAATPGWFAGRSTTVLVELTLAGRRLTTSAPVTFPARPAVNAREAAGIRPAWLSGAVIAGGLGALAVLLLLVLGVRWARLRGARHRRLAAVERYGTDLPETVPALAVVEEPADRAETQAVEAVGVVATVAALAAAGVVTARVPAPRKPVPVKLDSDTVPVPVPVPALVRVPAGALTGSALGWPARVEVPGPRPRLMTASAMGWPARIEVPLPDEDDPPEEQPSQGSGEPDGGVATPEAAAPVVVGRRREVSRLPVGLPIGVGVAALVGLALALVLPWWLAALAGIGAALLLAVLGTVVWTNHRRARFAAQLPEALRLVVDGLRAGQPLADAVAAAAAQSAAPLSTEFTTGGDTLDALGAVADRLANPDLAAMVKALRLGQDDGADQARAAEAALDLYRERLRLRRHLRTLTTGGRSAGWILVAGAIASGCAAFLLRPADTLPLYTERLGIAVLTLAALLVLVGGLWMDRLAKVEV